MGGGGVLVCIGVVAMAVVVAVVVVVVVVVVLGVAGARAQAGVERQFPRAYPQRRHPVVFGLVVVDEDLPVDKPALLGPGVRGRVHVTEQIAAPQLAQPPLAGRPCQVAEQSRQLQQVQVGTPADGQQPNAILRRRRGAEQLAQQHGGDGAQAVQHQRRYVAQHMWLPQ